MILVLVILLSPLLAAQRTPRLPTREDETAMFGRILSAVEDEGGGYLGEALSRFSSIENDLKKKEYTARIR